MISNSKDAIKFSHDEVISFLLEMPGREMITTICTMTSIWENWDRRTIPEVLFYSSHGEFILGRCGENKDVCRIDAVVSVRPADRIDDPYSGVLVGMEIKCSAADLEQDVKFESRYLASKVCEYYYLIAISEEVALKALAKYRDNPYIGVASIASGKIFKQASKMPATDRHEWYVSMMKRREEQANGKYQLHYQRDKDIVMILPGKRYQDAPLIHIATE